MITRERLESRLSELKQQLEAIRQQFAVLTGAIQDIEYWLLEFDKKPEEGKE